MPPTRNQEETSEAKIVSALGKEFNVDEVYDNESSFIGSLKSVDDLDPVEVPPSCPLNFDENMLEVGDVFSNFRVLSILFLVLGCQLMLGAPNLPPPKGKAHVV